ncbi:MAG: cell division protein FtsQ/DivIB [Streptosporangiaceae bacterium]
MTRSGTTRPGNVRAAPGRDGAAGRDGGERGNRTERRDRSTRPARDPWKAAFLVLAAVALVGGTIWALIGSNFFVVRDVQITGAGRIPRSRVLAAAGVTLGTPLVSVDTGGVARRVDRITQVLSARVSRSWPGTIVVAITPRVPVFAVPERSAYAVIDAYGVVLSQSPVPPAGLPVLAEPAGPVAALRGNPSVRAAGDIVRYLPAWLRREVSTVQAAAPDAVTLMLRGGRTVLWGAATRTAVKARELAILMRTRAGYYDVSDPSSAATGPAPTGTSPTGTSPTGTSPTSGAGSPNPGASGTASPGPGG